MSTTLFHTRTLRNASSSHALFLLHGTGGSEDDLFPLVAPYHTTHTIVGLRGNVQERGMNRFFARHSEGDLDQDSIRAESSKFAEFIKSWSAENNTPLENIVHIGYSNGANMILATMFYYPQLITKVALMHPMLPFAPPAGLDLSGHNILVSWSPEDTIILPTESHRLIEVIRSTRAHVDVYQSHYGHRLSQDEAAAITAFIHGACS